MTVNPIPSGKPITGRTVLYGMLAFFGVIIAVNAAFVYFALSTWPGLSTNQAYEDGLAYNKTLADAERQRGLGWRTRLDLNIDGQLSARFFDKSGAMIGGLSPTVRLLRPTHEGEDRDIILKEAVPGVYSAPVIDLAAGRWKAELKVYKDGKILFFIVHELLVK